MVRIVVSCARLLAFRAGTIAIRSISIVLIDWKLTHCLCFLLTVCSPGEIAHQVRAGCRMNSAQGRLQENLDVFVSRSSVGFEKFLWYSVPLSCLHAVRLKEGDSGLK